MKDAHHLKSLGIAVGDVNFDRQGVANHASQLAARVRVNLETSLKAQGLIIRTASRFSSSHYIYYNQQIRSGCY